MQLSETIYRLRTQAGMSQGDLAEKLDVSRQSVSKWETGSAVPDLDKLVKLSELFSVSLDELVKGETPKNRSDDPVEPEVIYGERPGSFLPIRKIAGYILFGFAVMIILFCTLLGGSLTGLVLSIPFWTCGIICFLFRQRTVLWCTWAIFFLSDGFLRYSTGYAWGSLMSVLRGFIRNDTAIVVVCILYIFVSVLIWITIRSYRDKMLEPIRKVRIWFCMKLSLLALCCIPWPIAAIGQRILSDGQMLYRFARTAQLLSLCLQFSKVVLLTNLLIELFAMIRYKRKIKKP